MLAGGEGHFDHFVGGRFVFDLEVGGAPVFSDTSAQDVGKGVFLRACGGHALSGRRARSVADRLAVAEDIRLREGVREAYGTSVLGAVGAVKAQFRSGASNIVCQVR